MNDSHWVDRRLASLDEAGDWQPDADRALSRLRNRQRIARRRRWEWILATFAGAAACALLVVFVSPGACARTGTCTSDPLHPGPRVMTLPPAAPASKAAAPAQTEVNFKESGSKQAPIACELYSDYECPSCARFYQETMPLLRENYIDTGKVRLLHRDFPLTRHPYSRVAARFANAAGMIGRYDVVVNQLFRTQSLWGADGNVDAQVMQVLPEAEMQRVRRLAAKDPYPEESVAADLAMAARDRIDRTPTLIVVSNGQRHALAPAPQYSILREYLDQLLAGR